MQETFACAHTRSSACYEMVSCIQAVFAFAFNGLFQSQSQSHKSSFTIFAMVSSTNFSMLSSMFTRVVHKSKYIQIFYQHSLSVAPKAK